MKVYYYVESFGESEEDLSGPVESVWDDLTSCAESCAEYEHTNCDGWEARWPLTFVIYDENKKYMGKCEVERDYDHVFSTREI